jgi:hypothetical protein
MRPAGTRRGRRGTFPIFLSDVKPRHDKMVGPGERTLELHEQLPAYLTRPPANTRIYDMVLFLDQTQEYL